MKKIFESVSDIVIPCIIFASIAAILVEGSLLSKAGKRMDVEKQNFTDCKDTKAIENLCAREKPTITCIGKKIWETRETIHINHVFQAIDAEGQALSLKVKDITDESGASVMDRYHAASQTASFTDTGIYTFHLKTMDRERKTATMRFSFVIDNR